MTVKVLQRVLCHRINKLLQNKNLLSIILLIREAKTLDPFLRKLRELRSVKFGTVILYKEEECRMLIFCFQIMPKITII